MKLQEIEIEEKRVKAKKFAAILRQTRNNPHRQLYYLTASQWAHPQFL